VWWKSVPATAIAALTATTLISATAVGAVRQLSSESAATPIRTVSGGTVSADGVSAAGSVSAGRVTPGGAGTLTARVRSAESRTAVVDIEVYDAAGAKVFQKFWLAQALPAHRQVTLRAGWTAPTTPGSYRIAVGVFADGWSSLLTWNNQAASLRVGSPSGPTGPSASAGTPPAGTPPTTAPIPTASTSTKPPTATTSDTSRPPSATTSTTGTGTGTTGTTTSAPTTTSTTGSTTTPPTSSIISAPTSSAGSAPARFVTLPPGAALPTEQQCAAWVRAVPAPAEVKGVNRTANATTGRPIPGATGLNARVTGNFTGSTEQILRWSACKWGIDEDVVKAQAAIESWWRIDTLGDYGTDAARCPADHGLSQDGRAGQCPESYGLLQVRYPYNIPAFPYAETSSAFNADYAYAQFRNCYAGNLTWLNTVDRVGTYAAGDAWGCLGVWFSGRWHTAAAEGYITRVKGYLDQRIWTTANFREP